MEKIYSIILSHDTETIRIHSVDYFCSGIIAQAAIKISEKLIEVGYLFNREFIPSPVKIFNITIHSLKFDEERMNLIIARLELNNRFTVREIVYKQKIVYYSFGIEWNNLEVTINYLNKFIKNDEFIEKLNLESLCEINSIEQPSIIKTINELTFSFNEDGYSPVGKDSTCWKNAFIRNLPKNEYLVSLFAKVLDAQLINENGNCLKIKYDRESGYFSYSPSGEFYDEHKANEIKDELKFRIQNLYDRDSDVFYGLTHSKND